MSRHSSLITRYSLLAKWRWFRLLVHIACLVPFALIVWDGAHNHLTVNPIQEVTFRTGRNALKLLLLTLACTPVANLLGFRAALFDGFPVPTWELLYSAACAAALLAVGIWAFRRSEVQLADRL